MATIHTRIEGKRGCGYRKPGGMYLVSGGLSKECGKLPIQLDVCPCCNAGIKPSRGWTWISWDLIKDQPCSIVGCKGCIPFNGAVQRFGLIWIGERYYASPEQFTHEAAKMGVSRRIKCIPKDFVLGETWVLIAHRKITQTVNVGMNTTTDQTFAGIFHAFKPTAIEYIVKGDETEDELSQLEKRGLTLINLQQQGEQQSLLETLVKN